MAGLRDQLLKSGLVNEKQVKQARKDMQKEQQQQKQQGKGRSAIDEDVLRRQQAMAEKAERDRKLNQQRKEEADKKAMAAQVRQLIEDHKQPYGAGDTPFNFTDGGTVKKLYLGRQVRDQLVRGQLAVVKLDNRYEMVPRETAEKIRLRDAEAIILLNDTKVHNEPAIDDPYADYQVPDDLIW